MNTPRASKWLSKEDYEKRVEEFRNESNIKIIRKGGGNAKDINR